MKRKLLAWLLTLCMVLTLLPATALMASADSTQTITVGVISYLIDELGSTGWQVRYWGGDDGAQDAACTATGTTVRKAVGSAYWNNTVQTFTMFTAEIPADATGFKVHNGERWFGDDGNTAEHNQAFVFNYSGDKANYYYEAPAPANTFTVTFMNGTDVFETQNVEEGDTATAPATNPAKGNLTFLGWFEENAATAFNFSTPIDDDLTLYAHFSEPTKVNGSIYLLGLNNVWALGDVTDAWKFQETATAGEYSLTLTTPLALNDSFKAVVVENDTIKTWLPNGENYVVDADHVGATTILCRPTGDGDTTDGWHEGTLKVLPLVRHTVTFNPANGEATFTQTVVEDDYATVPDPAPTKDNCVFLGWFAEDASTAFDFANTPITGDFTLTAHWDDLTALTGTGTATDPFVIRNAGAWATFAQSVSNGTTYAGQYVKLSDDFDNSAAPITDVAGTTGNTIHPFSGTFDGNGKTLYVNLNDTSSQGTAPFREITGATIKNLTVEGTVVGTTHTAGLVGFSRGDMTTPNRIENCVVNAEVRVGVDSGNRHMGGVVGHGVNSYLTIKDTVFAGTMYNTAHYAGGLQGWSDGNNLTIENCLFIGSYTGTATNGFHPIAIHNNNSNTTATVTSAYYTADPTLTSANYIAAAGKKVYAQEPAGVPSTTVTAADGQTYYVSTLPNGISLDTDDGSFYTVIPKSSTTVIDLTDQADGFSFKVYDHAGKNTDYDNGCSGYLVLNAPAGYALQIRGTVNSEGGSWDYMQILNQSGSTVGGDSNGRFGGMGVAVDLLTEENYAKLYFKSDSSIVKAGVDLTVTLVDTTVPHAITINATPGGTVDTLVGGTSVTEALGGDAVTVDVTPEPGYTPLIHVFAADGKELPLENGVFTMGYVAVTVNVEFLSSEIPYLDENGDSAQTSGDVVLLTAADAAWDGTTADWYVVAENTTISERITVSGDVRLLLRDGYTLTAPKGITVPAGSSLTVYSQSDDAATAGALTISSPDQYYAGIGGYGTGSDNRGNAGDIVLVGGVITAVGGQYAAGIGTGGYGLEGTLTVYRATVDAKGGENATAIGGGNYGKLSSITILGGTVTADSRKKGSSNNNNYYAAGIGGANKDGGTITISGGTVNAYGCEYSAGIGGGYGGVGGTITISGGTVNAYGGEYGAGIGGGCTGNGGTITISGGTVTATAGRNSAAIGGGGIYDGSSDKGGTAGTIVLSGGNVTCIADAAHSTGIGDAYNHYDYSSSRLHSVTLTWNTVAGTLYTIPSFTGPITFEKAFTFQGCNPVLLADENNLTEAPIVPYDGEFVVVTFQDSDTTELAQVSTPKGGLVNAPSEPIQQGFAFAGWTLNGVVVDLETETFNADATLIASYTAVSPIDYLDANGDSQTCDSYAVLNSQTGEYTLAAGWYAVPADAEITGRLSISGEVHLILCDNATLTADKGVSVSQGNALTIYAQSTDETTMGALTTGTPEMYYAGIGGYNANNTTRNSGAVTINGGVITATNGIRAAAIGGAYSGSANVTINGGVVNATANTTLEYQGAAIGGGYNGNGGTITINGGTVNAICSGSERFNSAGIGGGCYGSGGTITINGGTVTAISGEDGAGIGAGYSRPAGDITITGGTVNARSQFEGPGIGSGSGGNGGTITITGGTITAEGNTYAAGIGGSCAGSVSTINISGGVILAKAARGSAAIGGGENWYDNSSSSIHGRGGIITITGGQITCDTSAQDSVGIGDSLNSRTSGECTINISWTHPETDFINAGAGFRYDTANNGSLTISSDFVADGTEVLATPENLPASNVILYPAVQVTFTGLDTDVVKYVPYGGTAVFPEVSNADPNANRARWKVQGTNDYADETTTFTAATTLVLEWAPSYSLVGWINGANYGDGDDPTNGWSNPGEYLFVDGKLTVKFTQESWVFVKLADNSTGFKPDGAAETESAVLYDWSVYGNTINYDKMKVPGNVTVTFTLTENDDNTITLSYTKASDYFKSESISLNGDIANNLYVDLDNNTINPADAEVTFTWGTHTETVSLDGTKVTDAASAGYGFYKAIVHVSAKEMNDVVTATLKVNGEVIAVTTCSVKEYANRIITNANDEFSGLANYDELKALCEAMLVYGAAAQKQFGYDENNLVSDGMPYALTTAEIHELHNNTVGDLTGTGITFAGSSLLLKSETTLRLYFSVEDGSTLTVKRGTETLTATQKGRYYYVEITNIAAKDILTDVALTVNGVSCTFNPGAYIRSVLEDTTADTTLVNTVTALYRYCMAAKDYFG